MDITPTPIIPHAITENGITSLRMSDIPEVDVTEEFTTEQRRIARMDGNDRDALATYLSIGDEYSQLPIAFANFGIETEYVYDFELILDGDNTRLLVHVESAMKALNPRLDELLEKHIGRIAFIEANPTTKGIIMFDAFSGKYEVPGDLNAYIRKLNSLGFVCMAANGDVFIV